MGTEGDLRAPSSRGGEKTGQKTPVSTGTYRRYPGAGGAGGVLLVLLALVLLDWPGAVLAGDTSPAEAARLVSQRCGVCHTVSRVCTPIGRKTLEEWDKTVRRMRDRGAVLDENEQAAVVAYLSTLARAQPPLCP